MRARYGCAFGASLAAHALAVWLMVPPGGFASATAERPMQVVLLAPPAEDHGFPGLKPVGPGELNFGADKGTVSGTLAGADLDRIAEHAAVLFPFVTPGLALDVLVPTGSPSRLVYENPYLPDSSAAAGAPKGRLTLTADQAQAIVDATWSRGERWKAFARIRAYVDNYDADDPQLAALVALYRERNALQPYADGAVRDRRVWAQLALAADHVTFIGYVRGYVTKHRSTRVATELLFLLDTLAQANQDALSVLIETDQPTDLAWTRQVNPKAYLLAQRIQRGYARELVRRGLTTRRDVDAYYEDVRLAILAGILKVTPDGYRADDARYLMGEIYWRQGREIEALRCWRGLGGGLGAVYARPIQLLRAAVRPIAPDARNITSILQNEQGRWIAFSDDRLRRFGYRFDTY